jgi:hypothetical protein
MRRKSRRTGSWLALTLAIGAGAEGAEQQQSELAPATPEELERRLDEVVEQNRQLQESVRDLQQQVGAAVAPAPAPPQASAADGSPLWSRPIGSAGTLQLLDLSLDALAAVGGSTARDDEIEQLQGGGHDPRQRGFTLQQVELSFLGAVDPYVRGETHLIYFLDTEGESRFEIEEAFLQTIALPFGLEELGFQIEAGQFFTEFGRMNPIHPHAWDWQDQPVIHSRLFGEDGMRGPGVRLGWLVPVPWFAEIHAGVQNAKGETMVSFLANDEVFEERAIGGRPFADRRVRSLEDFSYLARMVNGIDLSDTISAQLGGSALFGPNGTGNSGRTQIVGADLLVKWVPLDAARGWPFVKLQAEALHRRYRADSFLGCFANDPSDPCTEVFLSSKVLRDYGFYAQALYGFWPGWAAGARYEYVSGSGSDVAFDPDTLSVVTPSRRLDPLRSNRHRISPMLVFYPSHFARLRLQYNYDDITFSRDHTAHSVWLGVEFLYGAHPAHNI